MLLKLLLVLSFYSTSEAATDYRKDKESHGVARETAMVIMKDKRVGEKTMANLKKICTSSLHKGCYFWKNGQKIMFQPLDNKGEKDGKIFELTRWLQKQD